MNILIMKARLLAFDSYMVPTSNLISGKNRLLEVDQRLVVPIGTHIRFLVTGADVLHSFAVPSFRIKSRRRSWPFKSNWCLYKTTGGFLGQCSEICGANHSFMPIVIEELV